MDPLVEIGAFSAIAVIVAGLIQYIGSRSQVAFIERVQADLDAERRQRQLLGTRVETLEAQNSHLETLNRELSIYVLDLTYWGTTCTDPVPRIPPKCRPRHDIGDMEPGGSM